MIEAITTASELHFTKKDPEIRQPYITESTCELIKQTREARGRWEYATELAIRKIETIGQKKTNSDTTNTHLLSFRVPKRAGRTSYARENPSSPTTPNWKTGTANGHRAVKHHMPSRILLQKNNGQNRKPGIENLGHQSLVRSKLSGTPLTSRTKN